MESQVVYVGKKSHYREFLRTHLYTVTDLYINVVGMHPVYCYLRRVFGRSSFVERGFVDFRIAFEYPYYRILDTVSGIVLRLISVEVFVKSDGNRGDIGKKFRIRLA